MEISLLTPRCTLVPGSFFKPDRSRGMLSEVTVLRDDDEVKHVEVPQYDAVLVYASAPDTGTSVVESTVSGGGDPLPEMFYILRDLGLCGEYNKILCTWREGLLFLGIAQGRTLLLANVFEAPDFTTAEYFIFLALKQLQLNPEVSTICWRHPLGAEDEMSLYRYFKAVETL